MRIVTVDLETAMNDDDIGDTTVLEIHDEFPDCPAPFYKKYPAQSQPQPVYVIMDEYGTVIADWSGEVGQGMSAAVWHKRHLRWRVGSSYVSGAAMKAVMAEIKPLLERVHAGHTVEHNGNDLVGRLTDDALAASESIEKRLDRLGLYEDETDRILSAWDYVMSHELYEVWPQGVTLKDAVSAIETVAAEDRTRLYGDVEDALLSHANHAYEDGYPKLDEKKLNALRLAGFNLDEE